MIAIQAVRYYHFGLGIALRQFLDLDTGYLTVGEAGFHPPNKHRRNPGRPTIDQAHQPGIFVTKANWFILLRFQRTPVFKCLSPLAFIGCAVQSIDLIAYNLFTVAWLILIECLGKMVKVDLTMQQSVENATEFPPKRSSFTQCYRKINMTCDRHRIDQIHQSICTLAKTLVYCF